MAQALDIQVVAEGIESPAQLEALRKMGCEYGQGFLFAGALSERDATGLVHKAAALL